MKVTYSKYSSWTGADIAAMEASIREAGAKYKELNDSYMASVALGSGHARWAEKNKLPAVNVAKAQLSALEKSLTEMRSGISQMQNVDLINIGTDKVLDGENEPTKTNWTTIGIGVGALILVVIIIKLIW